MTSSGSIDAFLARAMRGETAWSAPMDPARVAERALYHGIAGLLSGQGISDWPDKLRSRLHQQAVAQAMWEVRHKIVVTELLTALAGVGIKGVVLKGTAMAYRYYPSPAARARGDTDLLIAPQALRTARQILGEQGFAPFFSDDADAHARLQEPWSRRFPDGSVHDIDLHWAVLNRPALEAVIPVQTALSQAQALPALKPSGWMLPPHLALMHACLHRANHVTSPYFVDGVAHYGGDRLIWLKDIDLMLRTFEASESAAFEAVAFEAGVGAICAQALQSVQALLGTALPQEQIERLNAMPQGVAGRYLTDRHQLGRAMKDLTAKRGVPGKLHYLWTRLFPPEDFMRAKYPAQAHLPLSRLYLRRMREVLKPRPRDNR